MSPDRGELRPEQTSIPENPRIHRYIPHWFREHALATRIFLTTLSAAPGGVAVDAIYNTVNPSIAYADDGDVKLCRDTNYKGDCVTFTGPRDFSDLSATSLGNKQASSIRVRPGVVVSLYWETGFYGRCQAFTADSPSLGNTSIGNDTISSFVIGSGCSEKNRTDWPLLILALLGAAGGGAAFGALLSSESKPKIPAVNNTSQLEELTSQLKNTTQDNVDLRSRNSALEDQLKDLKGEVEPLKEAGLKLNTDNGVLVTQVDKLTLQLGGALQENATLRSDKGVLEEQAKKLKDDVGKLNQEIKRIKAEHAKSNSGNPKSPEWVTDWVTGEQDARKRWQAAKSKLQPVQPNEKGTERAHVLDRFKAGMGVIHEILADDSIKVLPSGTLATRVRAGIEYLFPEIWPDGKSFANFFKPAFVTPESAARIIYLPAAYRSLSTLTGDKKDDVKRIYRILQLSLHSDHQIRGSDSQMRDYMNALHMQFNISWELINKLSG